MSEPRYECKRCGVTTSNVAKTRLGNMVHVACGGSVVRLKQKPTHTWIPLKQWLELEQRVAKLEAMLPKSPKVNGHLTEFDKIKVIKDFISEYTGIKPELLWSKSRERDVVWARQIAQHLAHTMTDLKLAMLAHEFGLKAHGTISNSSMAVIYRCQTEPKISAQVESFRSEIALRISPPTQTNQSKL